MIKGRKINHTSIVVVIIIVIGVLSGIYLLTNSGNHSGCGEVKILQGSCQNSTVQFTFEFDCLNANNTVRIQRVGQNNNLLYVLQEFKSVNAGQNITVSDKNCTRPDWQTTWACDYVFNVTPRNVTPRIARSYPLNLEMSVCEAYPFYKAFATLEMKSWEKGISKNVTTIKELLENPQMYNNTNVIVSGVVLNDGCTYGEKPSDNREVWSIDDGTNYIMVHVPFGSSYADNGLITCDYLGSKAIWKEEDNVTITGIFTFKPF